MKASLIKIFGRLVLANLLAAFLDFSFLSKIIKFDFKPANE